MSELQVRNKKLTLIPDEIIDYPGLEFVIKLLAGYNRINNLNSFDMLINLQILELTHNNLGRCFKNPKFRFTGLQKLKGLNISHNQIEVLNVDVFSGCPNLNFLGISNNRINNQLRSLGILKDLIIIDISYNLIQDIGSFRPLKGKLNQLEMLIIKGNVLENNYQSSFENVFVQSFFPSLKLVESKFSKLKELKFIDNFFKLGKQEESQDNDDIFVETRIVRSTSSININNTNQKQNNRSLSQSAQPHYFLSPQSDDDVIQKQQIEISEFIFPQANFPNEQSVIKEESIEQSENSFITNQNDLIQLIDAEQKQIVDDYSPINLLNSIQKCDQMRKAQSSQKKRSHNNSGNTLGSTTPRKKIQKLISHGELPNEIIRLNKVIAYKTKELMKVDGQMVSERRQLNNFNGEGEFLQEFLKFTLEIDKKNESSRIDEVFQSLKQFSGSIDVFDSNKFKNISIKLIHPLINEQYHDIDQKIAGIQFVLDEIKKDLKITH